MKKLGLVILLVALSAFLSATVASGATLRGKMSATLEGEDGKGWAAIVVDGDFLQGHVRVIKLDPNTQYQFWWCRSLVGGETCSSNAVTAVFTTDSRGGATSGTLTLSGFVELPTFVNIGPPGCGFSVCAVLSGGLRETGP